MRLPQRIVSIRWLGPWRQERLAELGADRATWQRQLSDLAKQWGGHAMRLMGDLGMNALRFGAALLSAFFLFRDGDRRLEQLRRILPGLLGNRGPAYFKASGDTTRALVCGLPLAAFVQGLMAGLGYWANTRTLSTCHATRRLHESVSPASA